MLDILIITVVFLGLGIAKSVEKKKAKKRAAKHINELQRKREADDEQKRLRQRDDDDDRSSLNVETHEVHINDNSSLRKKFRKATKFHKS